MRRISAFSFSHLTSSSTNARGNDALALHHTFWRLTFTDKHIGAGGERGLLTGVQMADENNGPALAGQALRISSRAAVGELGSRSQSINNISVLLTGTCANVLPQSAASPAIPFLNQVALNVGRYVLRSWHRLYIRGSYTHITTDTPQLHPATGEYCSPSFGGEEWQCLARLVFLWVYDCLMDDHVLSVGRAGRQGEEK